jgi:hypothetical protein
MVVLACKTHSNAHDNVYILVGNSHKCTLHMRHENNGIKFLDMYIEIEHLTCSRWIVKIWHDHCMLIKDLNGLT